jgi:hypothetical protein
MLKNTFNKIFKWSDWDGDAGDRSTNSSVYIAFNRLCKRLKEEENRLVAILSTLALIFNRSGFHGVADIILFIILAMQIVLFITNRGGERYIHIKDMPPISEA